MLEGKTVNLRIVEKDDVSLLVEWTNTPEYFGEFNPLIQLSKSELQKKYDDKSQDEGWFFIEKKDGAKIGNMGHYLQGKIQELGYAVQPSERKKGYCSEAVMIMTDYLFLSKDIERIQAHTHVRNGRSQKVLEKAGFKREGIVRKAVYIWGEWGDGYLYSILREELKEPKILTKNSKL